MCFSEPSRETLPVPIQLRWVGDNERDRVAMARWLCYGHAGKDLVKIQGRTLSSRVAVAGDFLLAERDGTPVGTATSLSLTMWARGAPIACQGVAWVGAAKTERRKSGNGVWIAPDQAAPDQTGACSTTL